MRSPAGSQARSVSHQHPPKHRESVYFLLFSRISSSVKGTIMSSSSSLLESKSMTTVDLVGSLTLARAKYSCTCSSPSCPTPCLTTTPLMCFSCSLGCKGDIPNMVPWGALGSAGLQHHSSRWLIKSYTCRAETLELGMGIRHTNCDKGEPRFVGIKPHLAYCSQHKNNEHASVPALCCTFKAGLLHANVAHLCLDVPATKHVASNATLQAAGLSMTQTGNESATRRLCNAPSQMHADETALRLDRSTSHHLTSSSRETALPCPGQFGMTHQQMGSAHEGGGGGRGKD